VSVGHPRSCIAVIMKIAGVVRDRGLALSAQTRRVNSSEVKPRFMDTSERAENHPWSKTDEEEIYKINHIPAQDITQTDEKACLLL
jgi:hypothetical protein